MKIRELVCPSLIPGKALLTAVQAQTLFLMMSCNKNLLQSSRLDLEPLKDGLEETKPSVRCFHTVAVLVLQPGDCSPDAIAKG